MRFHRAWLSRRNGRVSVNVHLNYRDTHDHFGLGAHRLVPDRDGVSYGQIEAFVRLTIRKRSGAQVWDRTVEGIFPMTMTAPQRDRAFRTGVYFDLHGSVGDYVETLEAITVAFTDDRRSRWDSNSGQNYQVTGLDVRAFHE
jgi:hypothetical protein